MRHESASNTIVSDPFELSFKDEADVYVYITMDRLTQHSHLKERDIE